MKSQRVRIFLEIVGDTDRSPWEWGEGLARQFQSDIREYPENSGVTVECVDVESDLTPAGDRETPAPTNDDDLQGPMSREAA